MGKTIVLALAALLGVALIAASQYLSPRSATPSRAPLALVKIGGETLRVLIADTPALREKGLGGRGPLSPGEGMLFVFPKDDRYAFWMKDMRFSLDIIWLSASGRIVYMAKDVSPATYPAAYTPDAPARYVLEVPAGFADSHRLEIGDPATL